MSYMALFNVVCECQGHKYLGTSGVRMWPSVLRDTVQRGVRVSGHTLSAVPSYTPAGGETCHSCHVIR